ncbi:MAG: FHA domain-containing protein [Kiritimatiellae bacterium]|nr:FHA domain-containing protein [Kiritimatiellia bacterium]MCO5067937.1 FHA domain-containing protein [Kiritimatiellia bacterium]
MRLRYSKPDGTNADFELSEQPVTIGRSADADVLLLDERVSRIHCGIRLWDGDFYIKDLKSRNGTWINNKKVDVAMLKTGDIIRVGSTTFTFEQTPAVGTDTAIQEIEGKMDLGQGYTTILREIVDTSAASTPAAAPAAPATGVESGESAAAPASKPATHAPRITGVPTRKPVVIKIKRNPPSE